MLIRPGCGAEAPHPHRFSGFLRIIPEILRKTPRPTRLHGERSGAVFAFTEAMALVRLQEVWYGDEHLGIPL